MLHLRAHNRLRASVAEHATIGTFLSPSTLSSARVSSLSARSSAHAASPNVRPSACVLSPSLRSSACASSRTHYVSQFSFICAAVCDGHDSSAHSCAFGAGVVLTCWCNGFPWAHGLRAGCARCASCAGNSRDLPQKVISRRGEWRGDGPEQGVVERPGLILPQNLQPPVWPSKND